MKFLRSISCMLLVVLLNLSVQGQGRYPELLPHNATALAWSSQGHRYATGHFNGDVRIYDDGLITEVISSAHTELILALNFSPDGSRLVTGAVDGDVRIWYADTGTLLEEFSDVGEVITAVDWSSDGNQIFVTPSGGNNFIVAADVVKDSYTVSQNIRVAASDGIAWNPESTAIAIGSYLADLSIIDFDVADVSTRTLDSTPNSDPINPTNEFITSVAWHPTTNIVADGKINGRVIIWDLDDPSDTVPLHSLEGNDGASDDATIPFYHRIVDIGFSGDGQTISSVSMDGTLRAWDVETGETLLDTELGEQVLAGAFSPDGSQLVYSTYSTTDVPPTIVNLPVLDANPPSGENK